MMDMTERNIIAVILDGAARLFVAFVIAATAITAFMHAMLGQPMIGVPGTAALVLAHTAVPPAASGPIALVRADTESGLIAPPSHIFLKVPFTTQAPTGRWVSPWRESCEEASVAMAMAWVRGNPPDGGMIPAADAERAIRSQIAFEEFNFGYSEDTDIADTLRLITRFYHYPRAWLAYDISPGDIRHELAIGNVVIVPLAGALVDNPYYLAPPAYHMTVVSGYDDVSREFIVNDPGTKRGAAFRYPYERFWNAIHDWTGTDAAIRNGRKGMIVISREPI